MKSKIPQQQQSDILTLESTSKNYTFLNSLNDDDDDDDDYDLQVTGKQVTNNKSSTLLRRGDMTTDTDTTNQGSFTEDEMSSLDDEGMEQNRTGRHLRKDDSNLYHSASYRPSRILQIPEARAASVISRRKENSENCEIKQIQSTLIETDEFLKRFHKIAEPVSSSDPDSDYEPSHQGRYRKYPSNKFTHSTQHRVRLIKNDPSSDFGFSISDSAYEPGIYIHQLKPGGPAEANGLRPYDRILRASY